MSKYRRRSHGPKYLAAVFGIGLLLLALPAAASTSWFLNIGGGYPIALNSGKYDSTNTGMFMVDMHGGGCIGKKYRRRSLGWRGPQPPPDKPCIVGFGIGAKFLWNDNSINGHHAGTGVLALPLSATVRVWGNRRMALMIDGEFGWGLRFSDGGSSWDNTVFVALGIDLRIRLTRLSRHTALMLIPSVQAAYFGEGKESHIGHLWMLPVGVSLGLEGI